MSQTNRFGVPMGDQLTLEQIVMVQAKIKREQAEADAKAEADRLAAEQAEADRLAALQAQANLAGTAVSADTTVTTKKTTATVLK